MTVSVSNTKIKALRKELLISNAEIKALRKELLKTHEELDHRYQDISRIYESVNAIHSTLRLSELSRVCKAVIERTLGLKAFSLVVYDSIAKRFIVVKTKNIDKKVEQKALDMVKQSAESWKDHHKRTYKTGITHLVHDDGTKMIYIPFNAYRRTVGALCTNEDIISKPGWSGEDLLNLVTSQLTVALENSILYEMTRKLSIMDDKTKVFNHRYLTSRLSLEWRRAQRYNHTLSLMMADVDGFKLFNDMHGHVKGDKVLVEVAAILTSLCREIDVVARFGGDEFAVILPETDAAETEILAARICEKMAAYRFESGKGRDECLALSIGIATYPHHTTDVRRIVQLADKALYEAKQMTDRCYKVADVNSSSPTAQSPDVRKRVIRR